MMRAAVAQLRRLAWRTGGFRRIVMRENSPHAVNIQFAEAEHFRFALKHQPGGADGVGEIRIIFLNDHAALDAADKFGDFFQRQRMRESQLEKTRVRLRLAGVHI